MSFMIGTDCLMVSGVSSLCAFYSLYILCLKLPPGGSNTTPMCVGSSFLSMSSRVLTKPITAEVLNPFEFILGFLLNAKYALYMSAYASSKNNLQFLSICLECFSL